MGAPDKALFAWLCRLVSKYCLFWFGHCRSLLSGCGYEMQMQGSWFSQFLQLVLSEGESQTTEELWECIK